MPADPYLGAESILKHQAMHHMAHLYREHVK